MGRNLQPISFASKAQTTRCGAGTIGLSQTRSVSCSSALASSVAYARPWSSICGQAFRSHACEAVCNRIPLAPLAGPTKGSVPAEPSDTSCSIIFCTSLNLAWVIDRPVACVFDVKSDHPDSDILHSRARETVCALVQSELTSLWTAIGANTRRTRCF